jgi:hypothetical protein
MTLRPVAITTAACRSNRARLGTRGWFARPIGGRAIGPSRGGGGSRWCEIDRKLPTARTGPALRNLVPKTRPIGERYTYRKSQQRPISSPKLASPITLGPALSRAPEAAGTRHADRGQRRRRGVAGFLNLGFGRIVTSEIEVPNMCVNIWCRRAVDAERW